MLVSYVGPGKLGKLSGPGPGANTLVVYEPITHLAKRIDKSNSLLDGKLERLDIHLYDLEDPSSRLLMTLVRTFDNPRLRSEPFLEPCEPEFLSQKASLVEFLTHWMNWEFSIREQLGQRCPMCISKSLRRNYPVNDVEGIKIELWEGRMKFGTYMDTELLPRLREITTGAENWHGEGILGTEGDSHIYVYPKEENIPLFIHQFVNAIVQSLIKVNFHDGGSLERYLG